jgi:hypothetical protein
MGGKARSRKLDQFNEKTAKQIGLTIPPNVLVERIRLLNDYGFPILEFVLGVTNSGSPYD